ncbi:MAG: site-2 protease family protein [Chloroflexota bacterium]|nr:site-2 protease family protein [Chloroflexota bacterium]
MESQTEPTVLQVRALRATVDDVMAIDDVTEDVETIANPLLRVNRREDELQRHVIRFRGHLLLPSEAAFSYLFDRFHALGFTPLLREDEDKQGEVVLAIPGQLKKANQRIGVAAALFFFTLLSCLFAGAQMVDGLTGTNLNLLDGIPFAAALLAILAAHEFGHYLVARRLGTPVSLPYFIPMPLGPFGTLGAVINMTAPPRNRRHLLAIAVAGPLAGLVLAVPLLIAGLRLSSIEPLPIGVDYMMEGNSILYAALKFLVFGRLLPAGGEDVFIHQVAFAAWAGLLVTGLNLIPAGQLDGGHILLALTGERIAGYVYWIVIAAMAILAFFWIGWLLWLLLILVFGRVRIAPLDEITQLSTPERLIAIFTLLVFFLVFTPIPLTVVNAS